MFSRDFPPVHGCSQFQRKSGRQVQISFPKPYYAVLRPFCGHPDQPRAERRFARHATPGSVRTDAVRSADDLQPNGQDLRIKIRITEEERNLEQAAAAFSGETLSEFVRRAVRCKAKRTLAEHTRYVLDDEAAQRFLSALAHPSPDSERELRRLVEKPSVLSEA